MLKLKKVAVTGTVASGKSTVLNIFKQLGAFVVDSDEIVHRLLDSNAEIKQKISELVKQKSSITREEIAKFAFDKPEVLASLEKILHPLVLEEIQHQYDEVQQKKEFSLFVAEIPLLFEIGAEKAFDAVICVVADEKIAKKRFQKPHFEERVLRQLDADKKMEKADFIIENNATKQELEEKTKKIFQNMIV